MQKGAVNVAGEWTGGLQKPNGLKRQPRAGHHRCHGESRKDSQCRFTMKLVLEPSVWTRNGDPPGSLLQPEPGRYVLADWVYRFLRYAAIESELIAGPRCQGHSQPPTAPRVPLVNMGTSIGAPSPRSPASCHVQRRLRRGAEPS